MPTYDASLFDPPAPLARVTLRHPKSKVTVSDVALLLDTGADVTLVPRFAVEALDLSLREDQRYDLVGFDGSQSSAPVVSLDLLFLRRAFRGLYLVTEDQRGILGRDVLNHLSLLLDGPRQQWSEHAS